jgi:FlaA1/EpsC-like NDP-sugar epimerase
VVTGGTGTLGRALVRRLLAGDLGRPTRVVVFSRDEAKQHAMRLEHRRLAVSTDEAIYHGGDDALRFVIGDVRDYHAVVAALREADVVVHAAAMKQVPTCEYHPWEAVRTNVAGAENIVRAVREARLPISTVVGVSTDKAVKPVNVYGMTKAIQERLLTTANLSCPRTRFVCVRYGNVLGSRGSVVPLFREQIRRGGPMTVTTEQMTRFLLTIDQAVDAVLTAVHEAKPGETYVPRAPAVRMIDLARVMIGDRDIEVRITGARPGEKTHEVLVSEEECRRTASRGAYYVVRPILPELCRLPQPSTALAGEYSSADSVMSLKTLREFLRQHDEVPP